MCLLVCVCVGFKIIAYNFVKNNITKGKKKICDQGNVQKVCEQKSHPESQNV